MDMIDMILKRHSAHKEHNVKNDQAFFLSDGEYTVFESWI